MKHQAGDIAIIGAGPIGLEAALAASEAGLPFTVYEAGSSVGSSLRDWGHVRLFTPWSLNVSSRAQRRLEGSGWAAPDSDICPTGHEVVSGLLEPLAALPDLRPHIRCNVTVVQVGREGRVKSDEIGTAARGDTPFRLLLRDSDGVESIVHADVVLDCSGSWAIPNALGNGGVPAPGERAAAAFIERAIPHSGADTGSAFDDLRILLVGAGHSAQTAARELAVVVDRAPGTSVTWLIRSEEPTFESVADDPLPGRAELLDVARSLALDTNSPFDVRTGRTVESLEPSGSAVRVTLDGDERVEVDRVLALTGSVGDRTIYSQLQIHECWATQGPMKLAAALLSSSGADCLTQEAHGAETLRNPEPGFFIVGSKSYGRNTTFLLRVGYEQIDEVFSLITSRPVAAHGAA